MHAFLNCLLCAVFSGVNCLETNVSCEFKKLVKLNGIQTVNIFQDIKRNQRNHCLFVGRGLRIVIK